MSAPPSEVTPRRATAIEIVFFVAMMATVLSLGAALAHAYALPNKIAMPREAYFTAQQIYRGWAILGLPVILGLVATVALVAMTWREGIVRNRAALAALCLLAAHLLFWLFTQPANRATENWTRQPDTWEQLRRQWEYSHAAGAVLQVIAMMALIAALLAHGRLQALSRGPHLPQRELPAPR